MRIEFLSVLGGESVLGMSVYFWVGPSSIFRIESLFRCKLAICVTQEETIDQLVPENIFIN